MLTLPTLFFWINDENIKENVWKKEQNKKKWEKINENISRAQYQLRSPSPFYSNDSHFLELKWICATGVTCECSNGLAYRSLCGLLLEHRSLESEGLTLDSSWGLRIFSHCSTFITRPRHFSFLSNRLLLIHILFVSGEAHSEICDVVRTV